MLDDAMSDDVLDRYWRALNAGHAGAVGRLPSRNLDFAGPGGGERGHGAVRRIRATGAAGLARCPSAHVVELSGGDRAIVLANAGEPVALERLRVEGRLIARLDRLEDRQQISAALTGATEALHVAPYDPAWPARFEEERALVAGAIAPWLVGAIEHVGSTAIPGLAAKPVIDLMAGVASLPASRPALPALEGIGYLYAPHRAAVMHWLCKPSPVLRTHHLH